MMPERIRELVEMHRYMRPAYSCTEDDFNARYLDCLPGVSRDKVGNRMAVIGDSPTVLWSSHTDTVHKRAGQQRLMWGDHVLSTHPDETGGCLGADCTVGVWIMLNMYRAKIPGVYIWHACEEAGGVGSEHIAEHTGSLLEGVQIAIAFDRKGFDSVVTHQWGGRCASDDFARSLAEQLPGKYSPDSYGTFTDTANYAGMIPECTNLSVGYLGAHTQKETLDTDHAAQLLDAMLALDVSKLVVSRKPITLSDPWADWGTGGKARVIGHDKADDRFLPYDEGREIEDLLFERSGDVAALLMALGYTRAGLEADIDTLTHGPRAWGADDPMPDEDEADDLEDIRADAAAARAGFGG